MLPSLTTYYLKERLCVLKHVNQLNKRQRYFLMPVAGKSRVIHIDLRIKYFAAADSRMANSSSSSSSVPLRMSWIDMIDESVHTYDDVDLSDVDSVSRDFVVVKLGSVNVHYYYIPITKVKGWDGHVLWLKLSEEEVKKNYERGVIADPSRYFVKDYPGYVTADYPELTIISPRYARPDYTAKDTAPREMRTYECDLFHYIQI
jgi:hypothetical protein